MTASLLSRLAVLAVVALASTGCANTIRGIGRDAANTVDATQNAGANVAEAAD
jgi:entericidin B